MILSVMALLFAFTVASVSAQNAPKTKTSSEKVVSAKTDQAAPAVEKKAMKAGCSTPCPSDKAKSCATPCAGATKSCCSKGAKTDAAKPVPASDKK